MAKKLNDVSLLDIAPPSLLNDKKVKALFRALDPELQEISEDISEVLIYSRIDQLPEAILDLLAWQWHVDFYELAKSVEAKREMVKSSIKWHRHKGTRGAIIQALEMLGIEAKFINWYEEDPTLYPQSIEPPEADKYQQPYTFAIDAKLNGDFWERVDWTKPSQTIRRAIVESKAARSYMSKIYIHFEDGTTQNLKVGAEVVQGINRIIRFAQKNCAASSLDLSVGAKAIQGVQHSIKFTQKTHAESSLDLHVGARVVTGTRRLIALNQQKQSNATQKISTGMSIAQSAHYVIGLKQPDTQHISQNISNGGGVVSGTIWRHGNY